MSRIILLLIFSVVVSGARAGDADPANYAFASYFGSGFYQASGQELAVLNLPFRFDWEERGGGLLRWRLPVSLGVFEFDFDDLEIPDRADTFTVVPGVEWAYRIDKQWTVTPYADFGWGKNFNSGEDVVIYSTGVSTDYRFGSTLRHQWVNRLFYAGYHSMSTGSDDGFATLQFGVDLRWPTRLSALRREWLVSTYLLGQWHFDSIEFSGLNSRTESYSGNSEIGITLGVERPFQILGFELDRIGLGYRFVEDLRLWRLTINSPL